MAEVPIYIQIHDALKAKIERDEWRIGDRLPSERELAQQFHVSRMTLRQAIQLLSDEGILERKIGSGTYVANQKVQEKMVGTTSFTEIMQAQGRVPSSKVTSFFVTTPSSSEREQLQLAADDQVVRMERIRYADNIPICFEVATLPARLVEHLSKEKITRSLYAALSSEGKVIGRANQTISATIASEHVADFLQIKKGDAILRLRQVSFFDKGEPFEYVRTQYVASRFEFYLEK